MCEVNEDSFVCSSISNEWEEIAKKKCVPTQTQIRQQLGSKLSEVFFENLSSEARVWLGLEPPLVGPDTVWVSPDARLKNKVTVTPVPEPAVTHLKAFTHASILEVGQMYINLLENKHRMEMDDALRKQADILDEECRRRMENSHASNDERESQECRKVVGTLMEHFDKCFTELVCTTKLRMRKECQLRVEEEREEIAAYMLTQLQDAIDRRDLELCAEFHDILLSELNMLATRYVKQIDKERETATQVIQELVQKYEKMLHDLKVEMEFSSVVDVCQAITRERVECNERVRREHKESRAVIEELQEWIKKLKAENCTLRKMSTERLQRLALWRKKVRILLTEFQRFINFALEAVPGQSEFLLSVRNLMFKKFPEDAFLFPEEYKIYKNCIEEKHPGEFEKPQLHLPLLAGRISNYSVTKRSVSDEKSNETSGESMKCCLSTHLESTTECDFNFDYDTFKLKLVRQFAKHIKKPERYNKNLKMKETTCKWKKRGKEPSVDRSSSFYKFLSLVGENEKAHIDPVDCFLKKRMDAVLKMCEDDPEFAKIILGC